MAKIAVLGPGGVGGFVAAALARSAGPGQDVIVVAREETADLIAARGLEVASVALGAKFIARPLATARLGCAVDVLLIASKASGLEAALERIDVQPGLVVPLLNGIEHMGPLRARFGQPSVAAGVIRVESDRPESGRIVQSSPSVRVDLAAEPAAQRERLAALAAALEAAGIPARIGGSAGQVLWSKLARLNALALTTAASDRPIGFVRTDARWRSGLEGAVAETVVVANADGARLRAQDTLAELDGAQPELGSSMQRDIAAGREPELDAIAGAVLRAGARHGLRCPTVTWLADRVAERAGIPGYSGGRTGGAGPST